MASNTPKRSRQELSDDSDNDNQPRDTRPSVWPHFLMIKGIDDVNHIKQMSPFAIQKGIKGVLGTDVQNVTRLRSGDLIAEVSSEKHARLLLNAKCIGTFPVAVTPHRSLNSCKGVVRCDALGECDNEEIVKNLEDSHVVEARRIKVRRDGQLVNTNTVILTFGTPDLPKEIYFGYNRCKVELYIPNPLRCFRCQCYGHGKDKCTKNAICARCGSNDHSDDKACDKPELCFNCKGSHPSYSRSCPKYKVEQEIVRVKYTQKITFPEARKLVESKQPTYAHIVSRQLQTVKQTMSIGTQTELTWQDSNQAFKHIEPKGKVDNSTSTSTYSNSSIATISNPAPTKATPTKTQPDSKVETKRTPNQVKPAVTAKPSKKLSHCPSKGSDDPISIHNKYVELEDMETDHPLENKPQKPRSPVLPPHSKR